MRVREPGAALGRHTADITLGYIAGLYAVYHGPHGLTSIARQVHESAKALAGALLYIGVYQLNKVFFDTVRLEVPGGKATTDRVHEEAVRSGMNFRPRADGTINISVDETTQPDDLEAIAHAVRVAEGHTSAEVRVHLDHRCKGDALEKAVAVFERLGMHKTADRHGVLIYVAVTDRKLAVIGDRGIHERVGEDYWRRVVAAGVPADEGLPHAGPGNAGARARPRAAGVHGQLDRRTPGGGPRAPSPR